MVRMRSEDMQCDQNLFREMPGADVPELKKKMKEMPCRASAEKRAEMRKCQRMRAGDIEEF